MEGGPPSRGRPSFKHRTVQFTLSSPTSPNQLPTISFPTALQTTPYQYRKHFTQTFHSPEEEGMSVSVDLRPDTTRIRRTPHVGCGGRGVPLRVRGIRASPA